MPGEQRVTVSIAALACFFHGQVLDRRFVVDLRAIRQSVETNPHNDRRSSDSPARVGSLI